MIPPAPSTVDDLAGHGCAATGRARIRRMTTAHAHAGRPGARDPFGMHLRHWRQNRRMSQLDLAQEAEISTRHLSYVETGRAAPSREMVLRLAERLAVPLRERNALLVAAGYAPMYRQRALDDPAMAAARAAVQRILDAHEPWPALAMDRHWNLVMHNRLVPLLMQGVAPELLQPPLNVLRLSLHPQGLATRIANLVQWREHLLARLRQQIEASGDPTLSALEQELRGYPAPAHESGGRLEAPGPMVAVPLQLHSPHGVLTLISTITVFGTPVDVTLSELALETFFPADEATGQALRRLAASLPAA